MLFRERYGSDRGRQLQGCGPHRSEGRCRGLAGNPTNKLDSRYNIVNYQSVIHCGRPVALKCVPLESAHYEPL
jgi:hypothetical protein